MIPDLLDIMNGSLKIFLWVDFYKYFHQNSISGINYLETILVCDS